MPRQKRSEPAKAAAPQADTPRSLAPTFPIVGIGASAGGIEAFRELLSALPKDSGMAFVLLLHLPADHISSLTEILQRICPLPIEEVRGRRPIEPDHVYVLPGGGDLEAQNKQFVAVPRRAAVGKHRPIDHFFSSLAESHGNRAIGVVLSGTGADGTVGIQQIKAAGGITFAQDDTAQQTGMPRSAMDTGAVDFVLSAGDIARELGRMSKNPFVALSVEDLSVEDLDPAFDLTPFVEALHRAVGVDFTHYKPNTLHRRIARRIVLNKLESPAEYLRLVERDRDEAHALYHDILINVTSFFRNPEAFEALKSDVFPKLIENRSRHEPVRVWTLGCSTGEEAYSIAMAYAEYLESVSRAQPVQIFATDLNINSVDRARMGIYPQSAVEELSPDRKRRFFVQMDGHYRVAKSIRESCVFAQHNVLTDPPFSRIDLVSCRNMLIYLVHDVQQKVIPILHYALRPHGVLWLGTSETIGSFRDLFEIASTKHKMYTKKSSNERAPQLTITTQPRPAGFPPPPRVPEPAVPQRDVHREADRVLLARYAPPSVLVRGDLEILQYRGNTSPFLAPTPGRASLNLLKMLREGLVMGVRAAIDQARTTEMPARRDDLWLSENGASRRIAVEVTPIRNNGTERAELFMIVFDDRTAERPAPPPPLSDSAAAEEITKLRQELGATREYLQSVIEQQEAANEELQSANEEVQSANEELQSINEEVETSKEEVQSTNEELATINDELQVRNAELAQTNNDLINLLSSVQIAIVMLGSNLRIRRYTPMAEKLLNIIPTDIGRPITDIKSNLDAPDLGTLIDEVAETMQPREREIQDRAGHWYLVRISPYRTIEKMIEGAVLVFVDIDSLKRSQQRLREQTELLDKAQEPIVMWEWNGSITYWNKAAEDTYGFTHEQALGRAAQELLMTEPHITTFAPQLEHDGHWTGELIHTRRDGQKVIVESRMVLTTDTEGRRLVIETNRPITERKEAERILRRQTDDLIQADRHKDEFLAMLAHELRNPLAPLRNVAAVLKSPATDVTTQRKAVDMIERQVQNMARLIDDLLDVSRITLSQIELRRETLDAVAVAQRALDQNEAMLKARAQTVRADFPEEPVYVDADPVRLEQIISNLVDNASKYGQQRGEISVRVREENGEAAISVRDNGMGIDAEKLPRVFDLFMRATRSIDLRYGGLGIGRTIVRRLVEMHGGHVEARSEGRGKGSEFVVRLPLLASVAAREKPVAKPAARASAKPRRVLVVDDNVDNAESNAMSLRLEGHDVAVATSGRAALDLAATVKPDVALIDIAMPDMDGYELARELRKRIDGGVRLVAMSGYGDTAAREQAREAGFDEYLVKPASFGDLQRVLEKS